MKGFFDINIHLKTSTKDGRYCTAIDVYLDIYTWKAEISVDEKFLPKKYQWNPKLARFVDALPLGDDEDDARNSARLQEEIEAAINRALKAMHRAAQRATSKDKYTAPFMACALVFGDRAEELEERYGDRELAERRKREEASSAIPTEDEPTSPNPKTLH